MITYQYICESCSFIHEVLQSPSKFRKLKKCPACGEKSLVQQYFSPHLNVKKDPTTLTQQAEINSRKLGKMGLEDRRRADKKETLQMRFAPHVEKGHMDVDQANSMIEKALDAPRNTALELDRKVKKEISTGTKEEKQKKITNYIKKGKTE